MNDGSERFCIVLALCSFSQESTGILKLCIPSGNFAHQNKDLKLIK